MKSLINSTRKFLRTEEGASSIEYALLASLIAAVIVVVVTALGTQVGAMYVNVCNALGGACAAP